MSNLDKYKQMGAKAAAEGKDMTQATAGGADYSPPAEGNTWLRFVAYVELGKQTGTYQGKPAVKDKVLLVFELSGPKHMPVDGVPHRISIEESLSLNEKANFFKLFNRMNYAGGARHMVELLGSAYKGVVYHDKWTGKDGKERVDAVLRNPDDGSYMILPPRYDIVDPDSGDVMETKVKEVAPAITPVKAFLWEYSDLEDWGNLFIAGEYPERKDKDGKVTAPAKSKNVLQERIKRATNFKGSPVYNLLASSGGNLDIPDAEVPDEAAAAVTKAQAVATPVGQAADDVLAGVV